MSPSQSLRKSAVERLEFAKKDLDRLIWLQEQSNWPEIYNEAISVARNKIKELQERLVGGPSELRREINQQRR